uniref:Microsomal glutathione S-transferase 1 n=1 Tax=Albugo laibachii Nc14 TaxID=890382 RepID=F0WDE5_9STRA|nr:conserved hypothetical protein [Albugo laibachii Nc14]|eukprot:CCA19217.1 conserved hypothetical protein [Albugo laibachii Nc14]
MAVSLATGGLKAFAICSTTLAFKVFVTLSIQGHKAFGAGTRSPEDAKYSRVTQSYGVKKSSTDQPEESPRMARAKMGDIRWRRIVQNDMENIPIGLTVFLGSMLAGGNEAANCALIGLFTAARIGHTFAYAYEVQPHRAILWSTGQLCIFASGLNGIISSFT